MLRPPSSTTISNHGRPQTEYEGPTGRPQRYAYLRNNPLRDTEPGRKQILAASDAETSQLFSQLFADADAAGVVVNLGTVGFSLRLKVSGEKTPVTFAYGYPPNQFSFYFDPRLPLTDQQSADLRQQLLAEGLFKESGKLTLAASIDSSNLPKAVKTWTVTLGWAATITGAAAKA